MLEVMHTVNSCPAVQSKEHRVMLDPEGRHVWQPFARMKPGEMIYLALCGNCGQFFAVLTALAPDKGQSDKAVIDKFLKEI